MTVRYWATYPVAAGLKSCRIDKAATALDAIRMSFGIRLTKYDRGRWLAKDLGSRLSVIQSDSKRIALLKDESGWVDPVETGA